MSRLPYLLTKAIQGKSLDNALRALERKRIKLGDKLYRFQKAMFLTTIASSNRASEMAALDRKTIAFRQHSVVLPNKAGFLFKNQNQFQEPSLIEIPDRPPAKLCPVKAQGVPGRR